VSQAAFYLFAAAAVLSTAMAVTRREMIHAVIYLVLSFFSLALIFYMMGAPFIAAIEVLIYAGAIMVLFLFIVMMLEMGMPVRPAGAFMKTWGAALLIAAIILAGMVILFALSPGSAEGMGGGFISPRTFGQALYKKYMLAVEAASLLLLFALVGSLYLGRRD